MSAMVDCCPAKCTICVRLLVKDVIQLRTVPEIPNVDWRQLIRMPWSTLISYMLMLNKFPVTVKITLKDD